MFIKQISVFMENDKGTLRELMEFLGVNGINVMAISIADTESFGIIRIITDSVNTERAYVLLTSNGFAARKDRVICIEIPHVPNAFANVLGIIEEADLSVEYTYSFCRTTSENAVIIVRASDNEACARVLTEKGVRMIPQEEVDRF